MHRHLKPQAPQPAPIPTLSVEEEAILQDEQNEANIYVDNAAEDIDRLTEVADVAADTILVVDQTPEIGTVEQDLVAAVGEMAVAGTDANPEEVVSVTKTGEDVSVEGIVSALKSIWDAIVTAIKNMWVGLKHWLTTYFSTLEQNKKHAEELIKKLQGMKGMTAKSDGEKMKITDIFNYTGGEFATLSKYLGGVAGTEERFRKTIITMLEVQSNVMPQMGDELLKGFHGYEGGAAAELDGFIQGVCGNFHKYIERMGLDKAASKDYSTQVAFMKVKVTGYNPDMTDSSNSTETRMALLSKVRFEASQFTDFSANTAVTISNDVTPDMLIGNVQDRLAFIEGLLKYKEKEFGEMEHKVDAVKTACYAMLQRIGEDNKEGTALAKRMMPLVTAYSNWSVQPAQKLLNLASRHNKFWLTLFEMASNNYHEKAA